MKIPLNLTKSEKNKKTLLISQPIIFQSKASIKNDLMADYLPNSTKTSTFRSNETGNFYNTQYGLGDQTKQFMQNQEQIQSQSNFKRVLKQGADTFVLKQSTQNIFEEANNEERKKYIDYTGGPKYDSDKQDKVIKYSVVGYQQFLKIHSEKQRQYQRLRKLQQNPQTTDDSMFDDQPPTRSNQQAQSIIIDKQQGRKTPKRSKAEQRYLSKRDLNEKVREAEKHIQQAQIEQEKAEEKLPFHLRNAISREERAMKKFESVKAHWENVNIQVASNCQREPEQTIMSRADQYRERNQKIQAIELSKGEDEKNSSRYWYLKLRWYDHKDNRPQFSLLTQSMNTKSCQKFENRLVNRFLSDFDAERLAQQQQFVLSDIQANFNTKLIDNPFKQVETVISDNKINEIDTAQSQKTRLYTNKLVTLYDQKLQDQPKKKFVDCKNFLFVAGESQKEREQRMLMRETGKQYKMAEIPNEEPEIIINTWNKKNLAKSGEFMLF
ncbi:unnamed protein product (macronuclear) [Paramecium tetraurelia]|uniref:Uncharacterized protein n=1 Tax=Paramecium tetraurelia TaxID=5888 RepID=A0EFD8_PARTE|nr:uncharacterized protein GSPATT00026352001 [Paramecium tetraurelia]CAK94029.1 unnamed protein product [Paramecium tetraurelia]|eukprot:XP_001461402.1 hypothetical protein (macronuclear) [Paramecium tetraurelia strain d4-2]